LGLFQQLGMSHDVSEVIEIKRKIHVLNVFAPEQGPNILGKTQIHLGCSVQHMTASS
jgi:hypothetical protein